MSLFDNLHRIRKQELKKASIVLANAFSDDILVKTLNLQRKSFESMYELTTRLCLKYGELFAPSENLEGIIGFVPDNRANATMWNIIRSGSLISVLKLLKLFKKMAKAMKILEEDKKNLNIGPYIYLNVIGVSPKFQGNGFGGKMLKALIEKAENEGKSIYLETQTEDNVKMYEKFGFEVIKKIIMPGINFPMWEMARLYN